MPQPIYMTGQQFPPPDVLPAIESVVDELRSPRAGLPGEAVDQA